MYRYTKDGFLTKIINLMLVHDYKYTGKDTIEFYSKTEIIDEVPAVIDTYSLPGLKTELKKFLKSKLKFN